MVYEHPKQWDLALAQAEFVYNDSPNRSKGMSHFQIIYGMLPRGVYELRDLGKWERISAQGEYFAIGMHELQENIKKRLHDSIEKYKQRSELKRREVKFQVGDLVMAYLRRKGSLKELIIN